MWKVKYINDTNGVGRGMKLKVFTQLRTRTNSYNNFEIMNMELFSKSFKLCRIKLLVIYTCTH